MSLLKSIGMVFGRLFWGEVWSEIIRVARVFWREEEGREIGGGDRKGRRLRRREEGCREKVAGRRRETRRRRRRIYVERRLRGKERRRALT